MTAYAPIKNTIGRRWLQDSGKLVATSWTVIVLLGLAVGWVMRNEGYLSPDSGTGYWLGIFGCTFMLLLLTYSLRKRVRFLRRALSIKWWFQLHMALGIIGPLCIIFHSNFHLGSLNSIVALVCMLLVAGSGLIGRYIYNRIHFGLYGERIKLQQALDDVKVLFDDLSNLAVSPKQKAYCERMYTDIERVAQAQQGNSPIGFGERRKLTHKLLKQLNSLTNTLEKAHKEGSREQYKHVHENLQRDYMALSAALKKLPSLTFFEKMFSIWHVVHIPIFVLMIFSAIIHIVVVHMY